MTARERVKPDNYMKLALCKRPHAFIQHGEDHLCAKCGGRVSSLVGGAYMQGVTDAQADQAKS